MKLRAPVLYVTVMVIATSGLVYELLAGTVASYVLGDSVTQFATTIGTYMFAMGVGAWISRWVDRDVARRFIEVELGTALIGGFSSPILFLTFARTSAFSVVLYGLLGLIGVLVGLEIPLLMRILKREVDFRDLIAKVLGFDYLGSLVGSLLFALFFVPQLGLQRTSLFFGFLNCVVAILSTYVLADSLERRVRIVLRVAGGALAATLMATFAFSDELVQFGEQNLYADPIVYAKQSHFQRIIVTRGRGSTQLFLNGNLQFSSTDEHRYHEALVHPAMSMAPRRENVLVLGGGDGLGLRELLRYPEVRSVTLVDLDPEVIRAAKTVPHLRALHGGSLDDPRVHVVNADAFVWLAKERGPFDVAIVDFPDPNSFAVGKLYTRRFYRLLTQSLTKDAIAVVQSTSPLFARQSFWCVVTTMEAAGLFVQPYHANVPSFGEWGYVMASPRPIGVPTALDVADLRYLSPGVLPGLFAFGLDIARLPAEVNRLNNQVLVRYYESEWSRWN